MQTRRVDWSAPNRNESSQCGIFSRFLSINLFTYQFVTITKDAKDIYFLISFSFGIRWFFSFPFLLSTLTSELEIGKKKVLVFLRFLSSSAQIYRKKHEHTFFPFFSSTISSIHFFSSSCGIITTANISSNASNELHNAFSSINFAIRKLLKYTQMKYRSFSKVFKTDSVRINAKNALDRF